jgi:fatty acid desaturase
LRVLSDIVKRRSFRANVAALAAVFCALLMTCSTAATIHWPMLGMFMSAKLDRLAVGSILKQE